MKGFNMDRLKVFKTLFIATLFGFGLGGCATMTATPLPDSAKTFEKVVEVPELTKDEIYTATKVWIAQNFKSAKAVIEIDSKEDGLIVGNGIIDYPCDGIECLAKGDWRVPFTMRVDIKEGRFRLSFSNIKLAWDASYNAGILSPAAEVNVSNQSEMDSIKPKLLEFADQIRTSIAKSEASRNW